MNITEEDRIHAKEQELKAFKVNLESLPENVR
jgi:hypothetical protein